MNEKMKKKKEQNGEMEIDRYDKIVSIDLDDESDLDEEELLRRYERELDEELRLDELIEKLERELRGDDDEEDGAGD